MFGMASNTMAQTTITPNLQRLAARDFPEREAEVLPGGDLRRGRERKPAAGVEAPPDEPLGKDGVQARQRAAESLRRVEREDRETEPRPRT